MKTKPIYIIPLLAVLFSCTQEVMISEKEIKEDLFYLDHSITPYSGKCTVIYNTGEKKEELTFQNGRLHGESTGYYENGNVKWEGKYTRGYISGNWQFWDEEGNKTIELHYKKDTLDGAYTSWYPDGKLKEQGQYAENIKVDEWVTYNQNGSVLEKVVY